MIPSILFEQLTLIQNQYLGPGKRFNKDKLNSKIILSVATEEYRGILTVQRKLKGDSLAVEDLERVMTKGSRQQGKAKHSAK
jgi:hypothetical protein